MKLNKNKSGFTLLEIIIVIIIVGILASLALPKFFRTVEFSRSTEALSTLGSIRRAMDLCYQPARSYAGCDTFGDLSIEDPGDIPGARWSYSIGGLGADTYVITATRTTVENGTTTDTITINQAGTKVGSGNFDHIR